MFYIQVSARMFCHYMPSRFHFYTLLLSIFIQFSFQSIHSLLKTMTSYSLLMENYEQLFYLWENMTPYSLLMENYDPLFPVYGKLMPYSLLMGN